MRLFVVFSLVLFTLFGCGREMEGSSLESAFVSTESYHFQISGKPFYFIGTNLYDIALLGAHSLSEIDDTFAQMQKNNLNVVRMWGFSNGAWGGISTLQPSPYQISEAAAKRVDYVLQSASAHSVKIIFVFVNFENDYNGMQWYVDNLLGTGKDKELFYTDPKVKDAYKNYVSFFLKRTNTVNGKQYGEDPTIFSWELANEPHTSDNYEKNRKMVPGGLVLNWVSEMSAYVKSLDPKHMVSTGEEGYRTDGDLGSRAWLNDGTKGIDFKRNIQVPGIDFGTLHFYPDHWGFAYSDRGWILDNFVGDRHNLATSAGKPIIMEEFGFIPSYGNRNQLLTEDFDYAKKTDIPGALVWRLAPKIVNYDTYDFNFTMDGASATLKAAQDYSLKSAEEMIKGQP